MCDKSCLGEFFHGDSAALCPFNQAFATGGDEVLCSNIVLFRPRGRVFTVGGFPVVVDAFVDAGDFVVGFRIEHDGFFLNRGRVCGQIVIGDDVVGYVALWFVWVFVVEHEVG